MAKATARKTDYLFQRPSSSNWYIKLRSPGEKRREHSLGTSDKLEAEAKAGPMIADHKARLLAARPRIEPFWKHALEPGREHAGPDGGKIVATDRELIHISHNGTVIKQEPNGGLVKAIRFSNIPGSPFTLRLPEAFREAKTRPTVATKNGDDAILEVYLKHKNITGHFENEARAAWALFRALTDGKPLKECKRDHGRKLVQHFEDEGLKTATIHKKIAWLNAAVNFAIKEGQLEFNPFSSIVPEVTDAERRLPLDDADMKACKRNLGTLSGSDQLLYRFLASTGARLGEAFQISDEATEKGCRYCVIGTKTEASKRRLPFPSGVLPYLPKRITGPLFTGGAPAASKRLNRFLRDSGVTSPGKVLHSLRHRAQDQLRAAGCPLDIREELLGHEKVTVGKSYGIGSPVPMLRQWIDKIGC